MFFHSNSKSKFLSADGDIALAGKDTDVQTSSTTDVISSVTARPTMTTVAVDDSTISKDIPTETQTVSTRPTEVTLAIDQVNLLDPIPIAQSIAARTPSTTGGGGGGAFGGGGAGGSDTESTEPKKKSLWWLWLVVATGGIYAYSKMK